MIAAVSGRAIGAEQVPFPASTAAGSRPTDVEDYRLDAMVRLFGHYGRYGITGNPNVLGWLLGRRPTSFEQYVRRSLAVG
ncbi:MAG TPA: hypothetical protein VIL79_05790 [Thermoleophilia bacterium]